MCLASTVCERTQGYNCVCQKQKAVSFLKLGLVSGHHPLTGTALWFILDHMHQSVFYEKACVVHLLGGKNQKMISLLEELSVLFILKTVMDEFTGSYATNRSEKFM